MDAINARKSVPGIKMQNRIIPLNLNFLQKLSI